MNSPTTAETRVRQWAAVTLLTACTFLVVSSEMLPVGVLTPMARDLNISAGLAGSTLTITGMVSALAAVAVPRVIGRMDRRVALAAAMGAVAIANCLSAMAASFTTLAVSRVILGVGMGAVWGLAAVVAARLVAPQHVALAVSCAVSGVAGASVAGVPLGTLVGSTYGWRAAFALFSALALMSVVALAAVLPRLPRPIMAPDNAGALTRRSLIRPVVVCGLAAVTLLVTAHFAAFTFVRPLLENRTSFGGASIALLLLVFGVCGLISNFAIVALASRRPRLAFSGLAAAMTAALATLTVAGSHSAGVVVAMVLWGLAYGGVSVTGQLWMTGAATDRAEEITGLYVGLFTGAIALGAFLGGALLEAAGGAPLIWSATVVAALAAVVVAATPPSRVHPE